MLPGHTKFSVDGAFGAVKIGAYSQDYYLQDHLMKVLNEKLKIKTNIINEFNN